MLACTSQQEDIMLFDVAKAWRTPAMRESFMSGNFSVIEIVKAIPELLWAKTAWLGASEARRRVWRSASEELRADVAVTPTDGGSSPSATSIFPQSNLFPPPVEMMSTKDWSFVTTTLHGIERLVFSRCGRSPGPFTCLVGVSSLLSVRATMQDSLHRLGVCVSRNTADLYRQNVAAASKKRGRRVYEDGHSGVIEAIDNYDEHRHHMMMHSNSSSAQWSATACQSSYTVTDFIEQPLAGDQLIEGASAPDDDKWRSLPPFGS